MKARFLVLAAMMLGLASCQTEPEGLNVNVGGEVDTVVTVTIPETETRAGGNDSAKSVFDNGILEDENTTMRYILEIYYGDVRAERQVKYSDRIETITFPVRLVAGRDYNFVVWADVVTKNAGEEFSDSDNHYNTTTENKWLTNVTLKGTWDAMDESRDAFTGYYNTEKEGKKYTGNLPINITLTRPFAKLRVITTDVADLEKLGLKAETAKVVYTTPYRSAFNAATGTAYAANENDKKTHDTFEIASYADSKDGKQVLFTDYFFATDEVVKFDLAVYDEAGNVFGSKDFLSFNTDIPVKRNYLTTISGNILTEGNNVSVIVKPVFANANTNPDEDEHYIKVWDGVAIEEPDYNENTKTYTVKDGAELAWIAQQVNNGIKFEGKTVVLSKNICLGGHEWTPIGGAKFFDGTFDGNGKTVGDFKVTTKEGHAGLFGNAHATIKDLTVVNVTIVANHYAGAIVGQGYVHMDNCHVNNIDITLSSKNEDGDKAGGLVGQNCEGAMNITNSTAKNVKIQGYRDLGGIVGMAHYDNIVSNCRVDNITILQDLSDNYQGSAPTTLGAVIGRKGTNVTDNNNTTGEGIEIAVIIAEGLTQEIESGDFNVSSAEGLAYIAEQVNEKGNTDIATGDIVLNGDIDLATITTFATRSASNWTPIGTPENPFKGTFDGQGCTIKNLVIDGGSNSNIGFFGYTTNGEIKNVTFENAKVSGRLNVGVVAGTPYTSKYTNITVKGHVEVNGMAYVGAVGGKNAYADWTDITVNVDETSYVNANSVENGTAYRTYVGGVCGFNGEGDHKFKNITSNINVKGSTCDVGGLFGIAHYGNQFENCVCTGKVEIYNASEEAEAQEIGGIAGVWHPGGADVVMTNCSFTGELKANNSYAIHTYKFGNLVCAAYNSTGKGKLIIDGKTYLASENKKVEVSTADELIEALEAGNSVRFMNDIKIEPASMSNAYGATGINVKYGQTIDGAGFTLNIKGAGGTWDSGINTTGGLIKNLTVTGSFRGIFINHTSDYSEKVVLENVTIGGNGTVYTISCDQGLYQGIEATNCTFNGWTSFAKTAGEAKFVNCNFGEGSGYKYCRPYSNTEFVNCTFCQGYAVDTTRATVTFTDCTVEVSTADELIEALEAGNSVRFMNDIKIEPASMSNAYGATGINVKYGQTIDGNGYTLNIKGAGGTWDSGINTTGGLIKNLTVTGSFRGIFINHTSTYSEKVVLENVTIGGNGTVYTISCDQGLYQGIEATNCTFNGWTSFAKTAGEAKFVNCNFGEGSSYKYCRPYSNTEFVNCTFCPGYAVDTTRATVTFTDCTFEE